MREGEQMSSEEKTEPKAPSALVELAIRFFKKEGFKVEQKDTALEGVSGVSRKFDLIVQKGRVAQGVWIRDWNRTIGVNVIINIDKASEDVSLSTPIIIGEKFSDHAKSYANRRKITLLAKRQIFQSLR
jgi:galactitol-specific phosphotransferase system IIB component